MDCAHSAFSKARAIAPYCNRVSGGSEKERRNGVKSDWWLVTGVRSHRTTQKRPAIGGSTIAGRFYFCKPSPIPSAFPLTPPSLVE